MANMMMLRLLSITLGLALTPLLASGADNDGARLTAQVGSEVFLSLDSSPELPAGQVPTQYLLFGVTREGRPLANLENLKFDPQSGVLRWTPEAEQAGRYEFQLGAAYGTDAIVSIRRAIDVAAPAVTTDNGPNGKKLVEWWKAGAAAGLVGDAYDNRDDGHSNFQTGLFPQLARIVYPEEIRQRGLHKGAPNRPFLDQTTVGNCSMAAGAERGGSIPRSLLLEPRAAEFAASQYRRNQCYIYPEHSDYDPGHNGRGGGYGDLLPVNTPFMVLSKGSSGSDQPFIAAWFWTLASFRPEVKRLLAEEGLLMPALQMIFRMSNKGINGPSDYLSGKAHPTVFDGRNVDTGRMMDLARSLTPDRLPPLAQLRIIEEDPAVEGRDFFDAGPVEDLLTSPYAIGRVWRRTAMTRRLVVSAEDSFAVNGRVEEWYWVVLRGDPALVQIKPLNPRRSRVEIIVTWQERRPIAPGEAMESNRIDIGVFVRAGDLFSPPAFICFQCVDSEARTYDGQGRLVDIGYGAGDSSICSNDIKDWDLAADLILSEKTDLPEVLFHQQFTTAELAALREAAGAFKLGSAAARAARADLDAAKNKSEDEKKELRRKFEESEKRAGELRRAAVQGSNFETRVAMALDALRQDPRLAIQHADLLPVAERRELLAQGIARETNGRLELTPVRGTMDRLTATERDRLGWANVAVLRALYPGLLDRPRRANFVDPRLATPKGWRDVYHYDEAGLVTGWTRYGAGEPEEYTAHGDKITERDQLGRATATERVAYLRRKTSPVSFQLESLPGRRVRYEYASPEDRIGRAVE